jgi:hypothetical protein
MATITHVLVTAPEGRRTPVAPEDGIAPGGHQLVVTSDVVVRVGWSQTTYRSHKRGDLILCNMDGDPVDSVELAACPKEPEDGAVRPRKLPKAGKGGK